MAETATKKEEAGLPATEAKANPNVLGDVELQAARTDIEEKKDLENLTPDSPVKSDDDLEAGKEAGKEEGEEAVKTEAPTPQAFKRPFSTLRWVTIVFGLYSAAFLYGLDTTIAANVQGPILISLGEVQKLPWVGIGFPMGSLAVILLNGRLNGLFNIKILLIIGVIIFEIGCAVCGAAPTMNALICGRIIAGIGGSMFYIGVLTHMSIYTSYKERALYNSGIGLVWGTGCIVGPVIGGGFASSSSATWRWAFYINLPLAAVLAPIYIFAIPSLNPRPDLDFRTKILSIDWIGVGLNAFVFTVFQVVLTVSGASWPWSSGGVITLWVLFGVFTIIYALQQTFAIFTTKEHRIFPVSFLKSRTMILIYLGQSCTATTMFLGIYYIPLFFQFTRGDTAIHSAVRLLPLIIPMVFFLMVNGATLPLHGRYKPYFISSGIFILISGCLMHTVKSDTTPARIYGYEILLALGAASSAQQAYAIAAYKAPPKQVHSAIGLINVAQIGTITIALSIAGCIFENVGFNKLRDALAPFNFSDEEIRSALGGSTSSVLSDNSQIRDLALNAIVDTISRVWIMAIAAGALCLVAGILMKFEALQLKHVQIKK